MLSCSFVAAVDDKQKKSRRKSDFIGIKVKKDYRTYKNQFVSLVWSQSHSVVQLSSNRAQIQNLTITFCSPRISKDVFHLKASCLWAVPHL